MLSAFENHFAIDAAVNAATPQPRRQTFEQLALFRLNLVAVPLVRQLKPPVRPGGTSRAGWRCSARSAGQGHFAAVGHAVVVNVVQADEVWRQGHRFFFRHRTGRGPDVLRRAAARPARHQMDHRVLGVP